MPEDFQQFYGTHSAPVYFFLVRSLRDESEAQDLLQEVFLNYYRTYHRPGRPVEKPRALLFQMARYAVVHHSRRAARAPFQDGDVERIVDSARSPEEAAGSKEVQELMDGLLGELPEALRTALLLRYDQDMTFAEIGEILGLSETAVLRQVRKGEQALLQLCRRRGVRAEDYL